MGETRQREGEESEPWQEGEETRSSAWNHEEEKQSAEDAAAKRRYSQKQRNSVSTHMAYTLKKPWAMR